MRSKVANLELGAALPSTRHQIKQHKVLDPTCSCETTNELLKVQQSDALYAEGSKPRLGAKNDSACVEKFDRWGGNDESNDIEEDSPVDGKGFEPKPPRGEWEDLVANMDTMDKTDETLHCSPHVQRWKACQVPCSHRIQEISPEVMNSGDHR